MPRKFDYKTDFSQLSVKKTAEELSQELSNEQIQALLDDVFRGYNVELKNVEVNDKGYIRFECYGIGGDALGIFYTWRQEQARIYGTIWCVANVNPYYKAKLECSWAGYGFGGFSDDYYVLKYGGKYWEKKTER